MCEKCEAIIRRLSPKVKESEIDQQEEAIELRLEQLAELAFEPGKNKAHLSDDDLAVFVSAIGRFRFSQTLDYVTGQRMLVIQEDMSHRPE